MSFPVRKGKFFFETEMKVLSFKENDLSLPLTRKLSSMTKEVLFTLCLACCSMSAYSQDAVRKQVLSSRYDYYVKVRNSYIVSKNNLRGICDSLCNEIIPPKWQSVFEKSGFYKVANGDQDNPETRHGAYNPQGEMIIPCEYDGIYLWSVGLGYITIEKNGCYGLTDTNGQLVLPCKYDDILLYEGLPDIFAVRQKNAPKKWGIVDQKDQVIVPFEWDYLGDYSEGLFTCNKGGIYDEEEGVVRGGLSGYMDTEGKIVIPCQYTFAAKFKDGVAQVVKDGVTSIISHPLKGTKLSIANGGSHSIKVDNNIPEASQERENTFAFIFANENYAHFKEAGSDYAINDGQVFSKYCKKTLGIPETNVKYYEDATYGNMVGAVKRIQDIADAYDGEAGIIVYFSGLGAADSKTRQRYLLPSDASMASLHSTGYSVNALQETLESLKTTYTLVILDAPFNNTDRAGKPIDKSRGAAIVPKPANAKGSVIVCTGSKDGETAYAAEKYGHGLLTYALLEKLQSSKGTCSIKELTESASAWVKRETVKSQGKTQTPQTDVPKEMAGKWSNLKF